MYQSPVVTPALQDENIQPYGFFYSTDVLIWEYGVGVAAGVGLVVIVYVV